MNKSKQSYLETIVRNIAEDNNIKKCNIYIHEIENKGISYMSKTYNVEIENEEKRLSLFAKEKDETMNRIVNVGEAFSRELFVYNTVSKKYSEFQRIFNVPKNEQYEFATFYGGFGESNKEYIILENLVTAGYKILDRFKPITWEYGSEIIKSLAKFHSLSFVYEKEHKEDFEKHVKSMSDFLNTGHADKERRNILMTKFLEAAKAVLKDSLSDIDIDKHCDNFSISDKIKATEMRLLVHGDYKLPNIFVKLDEEESKLISVIPVDYQIISYGHPLDDVLFFLLSNVNPEYRKKYFRKTIELYYHTLKEFSRYFDINIGEMYPKEKFDEDIEIRAKFSLTYSFIVLPYMCLTDDDLPGEFKMGDTVTLLAKIKENKEYVRRINALVEDFVDMGYL